MSEKNKKSKIKNKIKEEILESIVSQDEGQVKRKKDKKKKAEKAEKPEKAEKMEEKIEEKIDENLNDKSDETNTVENENKQKPTLSFTGEIIDFFKDLVVIVIIVLFIRTFLAMPFQINGQSMYSSYYDKEFIIVDRLSYIVSKPNRGDVVVFKPHVSPVKEYFLKRVIGIPGDTIRIEEGKIYVKNEGSSEFIELDETYLNSENKGYTFVGGLTERQQYIVPDDEYFVLGDNRNHSTDSRHCFSACSYPGSSNFVRSQDVTGKVFLDLGYFNFKGFEFIHPKLGIDTTPKLLNSPKNHDYGSILSDG